MLAGMDFRRLNRASAPAAVSRCSEVAVMPRRYMSKPASSKPAFATFSGSLLNMSLTDS